VRVDWTDLRADFLSVAQRVVLAAMTTVAPDGRTRGRIIHPIWDETTAWAFTFAGTLKLRHLAANPNVALAYVSANLTDPAAMSAFAETTAQAVADRERAAWFWDFVQTQPPPYGYDPTILGVADPHDSKLALLRFDAWHMEVFSAPAGRRVWRA